MFCAHENGLLCRAFLAGGSSVAIFSQSLIGLRCHSHVDRQTRFFETCFGMTRNRCAGPGFSLPMRSSLPRGRLAEEPAARRLRLVAGVTSPWRCDGCGRVDGCIGSGIGHVVRGRGYGRALARSGAHERHQGRRTTKRLEAFPSLWPCC